MSDDKVQPLATRPTPDSALAGILDTCKVAYYASFDIKNPLAKSTVFAALNGESHDLKSVINKPLEIWGFIVRPSDPKLSSDGELQVYPVTLICCKDGSVYRSGSRGILQGLRMVESDRGQGPWEPPFNCVPILKDIGKRIVDGKEVPQQWFYLSPIEEK